MARVSAARTKVHYFGPSSVFLFLTKHNIRPFYFRLNIIFGLLIFQPIFFDLFYIWPFEIWPNPNYVVFFLRIFIHNWRPFMSEALYLHQTFTNCESDKFIYFGVWNLPDVTASYGLNSVFGNFHIFLHVFIKNSLSVCLEILRWKVNHYFAVIYIWVFTMSFDWAFQYIILES